MNQILATDVYIESWLQFLYKQCFFYFTVIISFSRHEDAVKMFKAVSILIWPLYMRKKKVDIISKKDQL